MSGLRLLKISAVLIGIGLCMTFLMPVGPVFANGPATPPLQSPTPPPPNPPLPGGGNPITQIINQIIEFPFENLSEALQNAAKSILSGTVTPLETFFSASIGRWLTASPGIITPGAGIANGSDVMGPAWRLMVKIAVLLWPLTLAIMAAVAAKDAVAAASWGIGDVKETLGGWLIAVVASATSLYWMDLANRFSNATTLAILNTSFTGEAGFQPNALTTLVFGTAGILLTSVALPASLIIVIFVILLGLAVLSSLVFQFLARFVILYILVALAPVVIILGVLPPLGWFRYMWLRGFVLIEALGPINALLLKLVMLLGVRGASNDPITAFVDFIGAIGVLSVLLTIDGVIIKGVFGAAQEVMQKAVGTVAAIATLALAGVTAFAGGSLAGAAGVAGSTLGGGSGGIGGGNGSLGTSSLGSQGASPAQTARNAFNTGTAIRGAGDVLFRQPGMLGSLGAAMRSLGNTLDHQNRGSGAFGSGMPASDTHGKPDDGSGHSGSGRDGPSKPDNGSSSKKGGSGDGLALSTNTGGDRHGPTDKLLNSVDTNSDAFAKSSEASAVAPGSAADQTPTSRGLGGSALPPTQSPSLSPMGAAMPQARTMADVPASHQTLSPEAQGLVAMLPGPLSERASAFAASYSDPRDQLTAAQGATDAFNQLSTRVGVGADIGSHANAWDRNMAPVLASARQGLTIETMAHDAGFGEDVGGFLSQRMSENRAPALETPTHAIPWHAQMSPHDWDIGAAVSNSLGGAISHGAAARVYHEVRSPETGGGWSAGAQFIQSVQDIFRAPGGDPIAALDARLAEMRVHGAVSQRAMTLWRANVKSAH